MRLQGLLALAITDTYIYIRGKNNNINILSSQVNFDIKVNIEAFDWRRILQSVQK